MPGGKQRWASSDEAASGGASSSAPGRAARSWAFWGYLLLIATIEAATVFTQPQTGLVLYMGLLLLLTLQSGLGRGEEVRRLALVLNLVPLLRMAALALPLLQVPQSLWYVLLMLPLVVTTGLVAQQCNLPRRAMGLTLRGRIFHLMMMGGGLGLGAVHYALLPHPFILRPASDGGPLALLLLGLVLFCAGFVEELIFRGLIQAAAWPLFGRRAIIYAAAIGAVLHIAYLSLPVMLFAFLVGLLFGQIVQGSGSILGVGLVRGASNLTQLLALPLLLEAAIGPDGRLLWLQGMDALTPGIVLALVVLMTCSLALVLIVLGYMSALS